MEGFEGKVQFVWQVADLLRGDYRPAEYRNVILPLVVLRRLDAVLEPTKAKVLETRDKLEGKTNNPEQLLKRAAGQPFYNTSPLSFTKLLDDPKSLAGNLRGYINAFSPGAAEVLEKYRFDEQITRLDNAGLLYLVLGKFADLDLHPDVVPNHAMGYLFEELLRRFSELSNETAGEHFTPREVIRLIVNVLFSEDTDVLTGTAPVRSIYDPACGTGGMLNISDQHVTGLNQHARLEMFGQELNPETWAIARSDLLIQGQDPERIALGNTLSDDGHPGLRFDYLLANPPFGVDWSKAKTAITGEHEQQGFNGRYGAGLPRISDGSLLFLQHMISKMKPVSDGGSRLAIIFSGSPLFSGAAGSGESEIRRWILENDMLEGIVALPDQLFYNTGISTYFWVVTNRKSPERAGKVVLLDARNEFARMRKSLGDKRKHLTDDQINDVTRLYHEALTLEGHDERIKVMRNEDFGYQRITVERPLRRVWQLQASAVEELVLGKAWTAWGVPPKDVGEPARYLQEVQRQQACLTEVLRALTTEPAESTQKAFEKRLAAAIEFGSIRPLYERETMQLGHPHDEGGWTVYDVELDDMTYGITNDGEGWYSYLKTDESDTDGEYYASPEDAASALLTWHDTEAARLAVPDRVLKALTVAAAVADPQAAVLVDGKGNPLPDPDLRDNENVPLTEDIGTYFTREVLPHVPDAWVDHGKTKIGYEIPLTRHFYKYVPPRPLAEIDAELDALEAEIQQVLGRIAR